MGIQSVRAVDASSVFVCGADGKIAGEFDPAVLRFRKVPDFIDDFGQILILAEKKGDIVAVLARHADHVEGDPDIYALLLSDRDRRFFPVRQDDVLVAVSQVTGEGVDAPLPPNLEIRHR